MASRAASVATGLDLGLQLDSGREEDAESTSFEVTRVDWDAVMRQHGRRVIVSLIAKGLRPERAKELAQDAWLRVIQSHRAGRLDRLELPGVVLAQANFLLLDDRRKLQRRAPHDYAAERASGTSSELDPDGLERQVLARDQLRRIQAVVSAAHPNTRRVFDLLYGGRALSQAEIAQELGLSTQRVRQIVCELRKRIRNELEGGQRHARATHRRR